MRLPLQLVSLLSLKLAVPATRITGTFQNNSVDGRSSALMGPGQAVWAEERELSSRSPNVGLCPLAQGGECGWKGVRSGSLSCTQWLPS